jgi:hypothetical protein
MSGAQVNRHSSTRTLVETDRFGWPPLAGSGFGEVGFDHGTIRS